MAKGTRARKGGRPGPLERELLGPLLRKSPALLHVLDEHGVSFCAGCYLTLFSTLDRVAAYHAVPDRKKFLADVRKALDGRKS